MSYEVQIKDMESTRIAFMSYRGTIPGASKHFPAVFKSIMGKTSGAPFFLYYSFDKQTGEGEMELCVPTGETPTGQGVNVKELPYAKAICTTHIGPYEKLENAYAAIRQFAEENELEVQLPWREIYIKGPGMFMKGNPDKYVTEIVFPLREV